MGGVGIRRSLKILRSIEDLQGSHRAKAPAAPSPVVSSMAVPGRYFAAAAALRSSARVPARIPSSE